MRPSDTSRPSASYRLERDGADFGPDEVGHRVGGDVRVRGDDAEDGQSLGRDLNAALTQQLCRVGRHRDRIHHILE